MRWRLVLIGLWGSGVLGGCAVMLLVTGVMAQGPPPPPLVQCQSLARVRQDVVAYTEQLAASLLLRAEKAEQELIQVKEQLEALQPAPVKE